ncbi:hypothetical protein LVJ94_34370 [Pendulispora rubella]|uniref:Ketosynthase family 3 (KS3) domain-containing protein n=2 Tax=Pendulispora rubella TaxID=2741070 RepID=A0ABZ2LIK7_9BACT
MCESRAEFWHIVRNGLCCLSSFHSDAVPLRVAGQVRGFDPVRSLGITKQQNERYSRAALLGAHAVLRAIEDAGLTSAELSNPRTVLVFASLQFTFAHVHRYFDAYARGGHQELGIDYWVGGTPASITSIICNVLDLSCPTLLIAGSCNVGARALQVAHDMFRVGDIDRAIIVGADDCLDPVFLSGTCYTSKQGYRPSTLSDDPRAVRPHDALQDGNAPGEGAAAVVLESDDLGEMPQAGVPRVRLYARSSRSNGRSPMASGPPENVSQDIVGLLDQANIDLGQVGFMNSLCEGTRYIEDFFIDAMAGARSRLGDDTRLKITNQEAAFGHIAGPSALIKFVSNVLMMEHAVVTPVVNCQEPYRKLEDEPIVGAAIPLETRYSIVVSAGAGGDATGVLIERIPPMGCAS